MSISRAGITGVTGKLELDVMNPNGFGVPLSGIDWTLSVDGARAITGRTELQKTIPARAHAPIETALSIDLRDAIAVAGAVGGRSGGHTYRLAATLHFSTGFSKVDVAVAHDGTLGG